MFGAHHFPTVGEPIKLKNSLGPFAAGRKSTECRRIRRVAVDDPMPFFEARLGFAVHSIVMEPAMRGSLWDLVFKRKHGKPWVPHYVSTANSMK
jgi:hypothetical protein